MAASKKKEEEKDDSLFYFFFLLIFEINKSSRSSQRDGRWNRIKEGNIHVLV